MIGLNQTEKVSQNPVVTLGARKRKAPSHYADHVIEIKKASYPSERKVKNCDVLQEQSYHTNRSGSEKASNLICILPTTNRRLKVNVVIKKNAKSNKARSQKLVPVPELAKPEIIEPTKNQNLLETLFKLCEQHKLDQQQRTKQNQPKQYEQINSSESLPQKGQRTRRGRQDQQKYTKMYEKYQTLAEKFEQIECETFII